METERWQRVEVLFHEAADLAHTERAEFLNRACGGDEGVRREVEALLAAETQEDRFLHAALVQAVRQLPSCSADESEVIGKCVGHYTITGLIGHGGMGSVYRATRVDDFRMQVAIKLLKRGTDTDLALGRFRAERQILARLQHPNIARLLDGGANGTGSPYFVMEYVEGLPFLQFVAPLSLRSRLELFRSVCSAVQYAHRNLIVHRDIKPGNILVTPEGIPKLLDFGIAKLLDPTSDGGTAAYTATGARLMTPDYASPEQVRGEPVTTATDVYSLGAVLYELLTGRRAHKFESYSPVEVEKEVCEREPTIPSAVARHLDPDLDNIVLMALRKEPLRRYSSVEQFSEDIRLYLEGRPVSARRDTRRYRVWKFLGRNRVGVVIAALTLLGVVTAVSAVQRQAHRAEQRFGQVRKLANTVLFDLHPEIESLAGSTRAREMLVRTSLSYLDSLAAEAGDDPALQLELATAYEKIGDVQGNPLFANLGHPKASLESYGKALEIAQKVATSGQALEIIARSHYKIGCVYNWALGRLSLAEQNMRQAIPIADSIPGKTGRPAYRLRFEAHGFLGDMETYRQAATALASLRRSLEIGREWSAAQPGSETNYYLAIAMSRLGVALQETGNLSGALAFLQNALRLIEQLLEVDPDSGVWKRERDAMYDRLSWVTGHPQYINLGDRTAAAGWAQKLVSDAEKLQLADPDNVRARFELGEATAALAATTRESDPNHAEQLYRRSLTMSDSVLAADPDDAEAGYWQSFNRVGYAWVLRRLGKRDEAVAELEKAAGKMERLARQNPEDPKFAQYLGLTLHARAAQRIELNDRDAAAGDLERSLSFLEPLYRDNPRQLTRLRDLADCYEVFGDLSASRSEWKAAEAWYQKSLRLWDRWKESGTSSIYDRAHYDLAARLVAGAARKAHARRR
uniref:Serine/threonine protein kinase with TPR repeats n=1 Tax=Solibacter usitatus (strain Ellin6076) TaxID=234267 RepID=Q021H2_SOLUE